VVKANHHIFFAQEEECMRQKLSEEYGRVAEAVRQDFLRYARRQEVLEKNPWEQGRDAAMRMVTQALAAGDDYFCTPIVSPGTGYIVPAFTDDSVRLLVNGALALEKDEYYKYVESLGVALEGDLFFLVITTTVRNRGITLARFFIQRVTLGVACVCYKMFFRRVFDLNPTWTPWHVRVAREVQRLHLHPVDETPAAVQEAALHAVKKMLASVLIGITFDFSASLAGGACDALVAVGLKWFPVDEHAAHFLFGCAAPANRLCDRAQAAVRGTMRWLMTCCNKEMEENLRSEVVALAPGRDCAGVLCNARL